MHIQQAYAPPAAWAPKDSALRRKSRRSQETPKAEGKERAAHPRQGQDVQRSIRSANPLGGPRHGPR